MLVKIKETFKECARDKLNDRAATCMQGAKAYIDGCYVFEIRASVGNDGSLFSLSGILTL